jgi:hypothetical protein
MVEPVLLHLGPALLQVLEGFDPSTEPDVRPEDVSALTACYTSLVAVVALAGEQSCVPNGCVACFAGEAAPQAPGSWVRLTTCGVASQEDPAPPGNLYLKKCAELHAWST